MISVIRNPSEKESEICCEPCSVVVCVVVLAVLLELVEPPDWLDELEAVC